LMGEGEDEGESPLTLTLPRGGERTILLFYSIYHLKWSHPVFYFLFSLPIRERSGESESFKF